MEKELTIEQSRRLKEVGIILETVLANNERFFNDEFFIDEKKPLMVKRIFGRMYEASKMIREFYEMPLPNDAED